MALGSEPVGSAQEDAARHYAVLQALRDSPGGDPLAADAPNATVNNPKWFRRFDGNSIALPGRARFQASLVASIASQGSMAERGSAPVAIVLAGPPGAGKSTSFNDVFARRDNAVTAGMDRSDFVVIDADEIKARLLDAAGYSVRVVEIHATREFSLESTFGRYVDAAARGQVARRVPTEVVKSVFNADGTSKPRRAVEALLTAVPSKVSEYRRYEARELAKPPVLVEVGVRAADGRVLRRTVAAPELGTPLRKKTKAEVLAAQRDRARSLLDKSGDSQPGIQRGRGSRRS